MKKYIKWFFKGYFEVGTSIGVSTSLVSLIIGVMLAFYTLLVHEMILVSFVCVLFSIFQGVLFAREMKAYLAKDKI